MNQQNRFASLELVYAREELESFLSFRLAGLSRYLFGWPRRAAAAFLKTLFTRFMQCANKLPKIVCYLSMNYCSPPVAQILACSVTAEIANSTGNLKLIL
jgi:hypothetical protein